MTEIGAIAAGDRAKVVLWCPSPRLPDHRDDESGDGGHGDIGGEGEEGDGDDAQRRPPFGIAARELPRDGGRRQHFDARVEPESDQGGGRRGRSGDERDERFDEVVGDRHADDQADAAVQNLSPLHHSLNYQSAYLGGAIHR